MMELEEIVQWFGKLHNQSPESIQNAMTQLSDNWITTFQEYRDLDTTQRRMVQLPLLLEQELDDLAFWLNESPTKPLEEILHSHEFRTRHQPARTVKDPELTPAPEPKVPINKRIKLEQLFGCREFCYLYRNLAEKTITLTAGTEVWNFPESALVGELLNQLPQPAKLFALHNRKTVPVNSDTKLLFALAPGRMLQIQGVLHQTMDNCHFKGVENWLRSLGLQKYTFSFYKHYIDDFLVVPFLRSADLDDIGVHNIEEKRTILASVKTIQDSGNFEYMSKWLEYLGFGKYSTAFIKNYFEICFLNRLKESHLERMGIQAEDRAQIFEIIRQYSEFSSVEATYTWLRDHGFKTDSFQFVRFNIPFYALPMVNFFIINEMGISNYKELLEALSKLKDTPAYKVKAMAYWLRDLELERYSLVFAKNLLVNFIEGLTILTDAQIIKLIEWEDDREKMKCAVHDMKEFQMYFSATTSLLQDLLIEKYSQNFAANGISIDMIPMLSEEKLTSMGIHDGEDRKKIMRGVAKMKEELPLVATAGISAASYYTLQRQKAQ